MKKSMTHILLAGALAASAATHAAPVDHVAGTSVPAQSTTSERRGQETWQAFAGHGLRDTVADWSSRAGYELVWDADYDFPVRAGVRLDGDFIQAITNLFNAYAAADRPLSVDIFKEQKLVHVQARGE